MNPCWPQSVARFVVIVVFFLRSRPALRARQRSGLADDLVDHVDIGLDIARGFVDELGRVVADLVKPLGSHRLHRATHDRVVFEDGVEVIDGQRKEAAVGFGSDTRHSLGIRQKADLCVRKEGQMLMRG